MAFSSVLTGGDDFIIRKWILAKGTQQEAELAFEAEGAVTSIASSVRSFDTRFLCLR